jgi:hypothetical protein
MRTPGGVGVDAPGQEQRDGRNDSNHHP